jgi:hypothetical protein
MVWWCLATFFGAPRRLAPHKQRDVNMHVCVRREGVRGVLVTAYVCDI